MSSVPFPRDGLAPEPRALPAVQDVSAAKQAGRAARDHRLVGVGVVLFVLLVHCATNYFSGVEARRVLTHLAWLCVEVPILMGALGLTYRALKHHQVGARSAVGITVLVAGVLGVSFGLVLFLVSRHFPMVLLRPVPNFTVAWAALYGFTFAQFHMGLWALAFAYPFAIDEVRLKGLETEKLKTAAELARLRAHLEPHFLLNTLNAIAGLVTEEPREARRLIGCLGDLLRDALHDDDELQTLHAQMAWLQRYAAILQARHAGALRFDWDIAPNTRGVLLPRLLLQPLVENAVKHGALQSQEEGRVAVVVAFRDDTLVLTVEDNGPGAASEEVREGAFGLRSVTRRAELRYPGSKVVLERLKAGTGTCARIEIPRDELDVAPPTSDRQP